MKNIFTSLLLSTAAVVQAEKEGISFVVVGDFAHIKDMSHANTVFDSINAMKENADPDSAENFDFFVTAGDNVYVVDQRNP